MLGTMPQINCAHCGNINIRLVIWLSDEVAKMKCNNCKQTFSVKLKKINTNQSQIGCNLRRAR